MELLDSSMRIFWFRVLMVRESILKVLRFCRDLKMNGILIILRVPRCHRVLRVLKFLKMVNVVILCSSSTYRYKLVGGFVFLLFISNFKNRY